jgi:hypothetical protein
LQQQDKQRRAKNTVASSTATTATFTFSTVTIGVKLRKAGKAIPIYVRVIKVLKKQTPVDYVISGNYPSR